MEKLSCPVCKAENAQGPFCRRCKADLSLLFSLRQQLRARAVEALVKRDFGRAWRYYRVMKQNRRGL